MQTCKAACLRQERKSQICLYKALHQRCTFTYLRFSDSGSFGSQRVGEGNGIQDHSGLIAIFFLLPGVKDNIWEEKTIFHHSNWKGCQVRKRHNQITELRRVFPSPCKAQLQKHYSSSKYVGKVSYTKRDHCRDKTHPPPRLDGNISAWSCLQAALPWACRVLQVC